MSVIQKESMNQDITASDVLNRRDLLRDAAMVSGTVLMGKNGWAVNESDAPGKEELVRFGETDLHVSRYCQGTAFRKVARSDNPEARRILETAMDIGVNFFDSAEAYGWGGSEEVLGRVVKGRRDRVVISTKAAPSLPPERDPDSNRFRLGRQIAFNRQVLERKLEGSLRRLQTDYIDLYFLHQPDQFGTSLQELAAWMGGLVRKGKIRYWGVSNFAAFDVAQLKAFSVAEQGRYPLAGTQDYFNIVARHVVEPRLLNVIGELRLGLMAFSPQDAGRLAPGRKIPPALKQLVNALDEVSQNMGATRPQVTIAWVLSHPQVTCALGGAETPDQVRENVKGVPLTLNSELIERLNQSSDLYLATKT